MHSAEVIKRLELLRAAKVRPPRDSSVGGAIDLVAGDLATRQRRLRGVGEVWDELCPVRYAPATEVVGITRGVLKVRVDDAATRFALDRWLRQGGADAVIRASRAPVKKVRLEL